MIKLLSLSALIFLFTTSSVFAVNSSTSSNNNMTQSAVHLSDNNQRSNDGYNDHSAQSFIDHGKTSPGWNPSEKKGWHQKHHKHYRHPGNQGKSNSEHVYH